MPLYDRRDSESTIWNVLERLEVRIEDLEKFHCTLERAARDYLSSGDDPNLRRIADEMLEAIELAREEAK